MSDTESTSAFIREARARFAAFRASVPEGAPLSILCHSDGDGLAVGALLARAWERDGGCVEVAVTGKGGNAWDAEGRALLLRLGGGRAPIALAVCDLGVRAEPVLPESAAPTLFIDHHKPAGLPGAPAAVVSGYGLEPTPTSGLLAYWCAGPAPGEDGSEPPDDPELDWLAAISLLSDLGDKAPFSLFARAKKKYKATVLREATTLLNAPRRAASGDATPALRLLRRCREPREIISGDHPETAELRAAREEVAAAYAEAKKAPPRFGTVGEGKEVAMVRIHTPCQVHPLVAQIWRTRLPKHFVFGVNTGFRPGWVHFSGRCGRDRNLITFLRAHRPEGADPLHYGNGHDQAAGGALPITVWNEWARGLGFGSEMMVKEA